MSVAGLSLWQLQCQKDTFVSWMIATATTGMPRNGRQGFSGLLGFDGLIVGRTGGSRNNDLGTNLESVPVDVRIGRFDLSQCDWL